jgi:hypothetical protein
MKSDELFPNLFEFLREEGQELPEEALRQPAPAQLEPKEFKTETYPCDSCSRFAFGKPVRCYWCINGR